MEKIEEHMTVFDTRSAYALPEEKRQIMRKPFPSEKSARKTFSGKSAGFTRLCMWKTVWTGAS